MRRAAHLGTSAISDALDRFSLAGQLEGLRALAPAHHLAGRAFTVRMRAERGGNVGDYLDDVAPGDVIVIANEGRLECTVWGELLTFAATRGGVAGTVIDGVFRDSSAVRELSYPIFARGAFMRTGKDRVALDAVLVDVTVCGARVSPGDLIVGDADGVVVVPRARESEVLDAAEEIEAVERAIRAALAAGSRLDDARRAAGYHALQGGAAR